MSLSTVRTQTRLCENTPFRVTRHETTPVKKLNTWLVTNDVRANRGLLLQRVIFTWFGGGEDNHVYSSYLLTHRLRKFLISKIYR